MTEHYTTKEVAEQLKYSEDTIRKWCREDKIATLPKASPKSEWRIPADYKARWCAKHGIKADE